MSSYTSDTEVKTSRGWSPIGDVQSGTKVTALDLSMNTASYERVTSVDQTDYDGELLHFGHRYFSLLVPPEHSMVVSDKSGNLSVRPARTIKEHNTQPRRGYQWCGQSGADQIFTLQSVTQNEQYSRRKIVVAEKHIDLGGWLEFFGFYLADGSVRQGLNVHGHPYYTVSIKQSEKNEDYVLGLYDRIGFPCSVYRNKTGNHNYNVYSKQLWTHLNEFGNSRAKFIPAEYLALDTPMLERLWTGFTNGDSQMNSGIFQVGSVSTPLLEGLQDMALKVLGRVVQIVDKKATYRGEPYEYYQLSFSPGNKTRNFKYGLPERVPYRGQLHGLQLAHGGAILVRHDGRISWSGV